MARVLPQAKRRSQLSTIKNVDVVRRVRATVEHHRCATDEDVFEVACGKRVDDDVDRHVSRRSSDRSDRLRFYAFAFLQIGDRAVCAFPSFFGRQLHQAQGYRHVDSSAHVARNGTFRFVDECPDSGRTFCRIVHL